MNKYHYYCFSFIDSLGFASVYKGLSNNQITMQDIDSAKLDAKVESSAVLISASYLGYMTKEEVRNT